MGYYVSLPLRYYSIYFLLEFSYEGGLQYIMVKLYINLMFFAAYNMP